MNQSERDDVTTPTFPDIGLQGFAPRLAGFNAKAVSRSACHRNPRPSGFSSRESINCFAAFLDSMDCTAKDLNCFDKLNA